MAVNRRRTFSDADKVKYWREKAKSGSANAPTRNYSENAGRTKKSCASFTPITKGLSKGAFAVNAFKKTKYGVIKATAFPATTKTSESDKGNEFMGYHVNITDMNTLQTTKYRGIMNINTKVLVISDLGMCITPNGSGRTRTGKLLKGYFGTYHKQN